MKRRAESSVDTYRLLPRFRAEVNTGRIERIVIEVSAAAVHVSSAASIGGDARALRGIPAVGHGVSGHIAGTQPEEAALDQDEGRLTA